MANKQGDFIWYELLTDDADAAQAFYGEVLGWQVTDSGVANMDYRILQATDPDSGEVNPVAGLMQITPEMQDGGARPLWLGYIAVDDVDASVGRIVAAGGNLRMPATDIPDVGRIAMVTDPQGTPFYVMRGSSEDTSLAFAFDRPRVGHCAWNELSTTDPEAAKRFYFEEFGWQKDDEMDMGEMGAYEFLRHGGIIGALMRKPDNLPQSLWQYYFRVADIDQAAAKITAAGGQVLYGPEQVPGGDHIIQGMDPQGTAFSLVGARQA
jgi:predicted enzyme related to lactoylglutathione lyase